MLPYVDFWTKLCFADLSTYGKRYSEFLSEPSCCGRNYRIKNTSNTSVENIFKFIKFNNKLTIKIPLVVKFAEKLIKKVDSLSKEFIDRLLRNLNEKKTKTIQREM